MGDAEFDYEGDTVLVTGASAGIGRSVALAFADAGAAVVNADVDPTPKASGESVPTHERIRSTGGDAAFVETDVREAEQVRAAVDACAEFGGVDVLVNNAGVHSMAPLLEVTEAEFDRVHDVNVKGYLFGMQAAARAMMERDTPGAIVNVASISSTLSKPGQIAYESSKGAVRMLTRSAAVDLADEGIRVNAVAPGRVATAFTERSAEEMRASVDEGDLYKPIPLDRAGVPDDVTGAALFLASDAASYVTGELLYVDGGYQTA